MCYAFQFLAEPRLDPAHVVGTFNLFDEAAPEGLACWAFSNHDVPRDVTRWSLSPAALRLQRQ